MLRVSPSAALFLACLCLISWGFCAGQVGGFHDFNVGAIVCRLKWTGLPPRATVTLDCSPLQGVHVTPDEPVLDRILSDAFNWMRQASVTPFKLSLSLSDLHLSLEALTQSLDSYTLQTELLLNRCAIQALKPEFFASRLFPVSKANSGSVRFHNCRFDGVACKDLATAFNASLNVLEFVNCTWCSGDVTLTKVIAKDFNLHQPAAQLGLTLHLKDLSVANKLSVVINSGWQPMRLGRVRPGHLTLTGVQLLGPLDSTFLQGANLYGMTLQRCQLPNGAADDLLRNVLDVDNVLMDATDLGDLPLARRGLTLKVLEMQNCRLARLDFLRLAGATSLVDLKLANASIDQLPESWALVANGSILPRLTSVNLTGNAIRRLPRVPNGRVYSDSAHFVVLIGGNPLQCDCGLKWLGASGNDVSLVYWNDDPTCASPEHLRGMLVAKVFSSHDPCAPPPPPTATVATVASAAAEAGVSVLAIVVAVIVVIIVVTVLLVLCLKFKDRVCSRASQGKVKYTAANKEDVTTNDKTTMLTRGNESQGTRPTNV